jgi:hypothetical protein
VLQLEGTESSDKVAELAIGLRLMPRLVLAVDPLGDAVEEGTDDSKVLVAQFGKERFGAGQENFLPLLLSWYRGECGGRRRQSRGLWVNNGGVDLNVAFATASVRSTASPSMLTIFNANKLVNQAFVCKLIAHRCRHVYGAVDDDEGLDGSVGER